ncbi:hypothetical protein SLA2020_344580 [Shorea laevis]
MLWRYKWSLLHSPQRNQILKGLPFLSIRLYSSPEVCPPAKSHESCRENLTPDHGIFQKDRIVLTPQIVGFTLLNCPSDLIALSFFMWCGKQHNYFHDSQAFDCMVSILTRLTKRCKTVRGIIQELESVGCVIKAQTFLLLLRIYWRGGLYAMVFETYEEMERFGFTPNTFARNVIMDVLFRVGHVDIALMVLKETQFPNFLTFNIALCNFCKLNDLSKIKNVIRRMLREGYYPNIETFHLILSSFCKMGRMAEAYQLLGLIITGGNSLSVNVWSILIDGFCRLCKPSIGCDLMKKMLLVGCSPNVVTYTTLIKGLLASKKFDVAFSLLNSMESDGCPPDLVLYNVLIDCLSKIGRYDDALDVFRCMSESKLEPDSYTFSSLISNICLSRRFSLLPKIASGLAVEADLVLCNSLLNYFCKAGYPLLAVQLYDYMLDQDFIPDKYSFVGLISGLCGAGRVEEAVNVYHGIVMYCPGIDAHVHTVIVDGLIRLGKCHKAIRLFRRALTEKHPLDGVSYLVAMHGLLRRGRVTEASNLYSQMRELGYCPNAQMYNVIISYFCKERDVKMVRQLIQEISEAGIKLNSKTLIKSARLLFKSHSTLNKLVAMWNSGLIPDGAMNELLVSCCLEKCNTNYLEGYLEDNLAVDSSNNLDDVAASVG